MLTCSVISYFWGGGDNGGKFGELDLLMKQIGPRGMLWCQVRDSEGHGNSLRLMWKIM